MPRASVPPALVAEVKQAMISTSEKIFQSRSADRQVSGEPSTNPQYAVKRIVWEK